jgi:hypothetical protein
MISNNTSTSSVGCSTIRQYSQKQKSRKNLKKKILRTLILNTKQETRSLVHALE